MSALFQKSAAKKNDSFIRNILFFSIFNEIGSNRNGLFTFLFILYIATVVVNVSLMALLYLDTSLHKPMYMFLFCLMVNGLIGSTAVWPRVMFLLMTEVNTSLYASCLIQFFILGSYGGCNFTILTVMAYDRLVSIFQPLQYHTIMTPLKIKRLLVVASITPAALVIGQICLTSQTPLCKFKLHRLFCDNLSVSSLLCGDTFQSLVSNLYGICGLFIFVVLPIFLVFMSYVKIIRLTLKASMNARNKVFKTCTPHIIVFIIFSLASLFSVIYNRANPRLPGEAHIFVSITYILVPPLLHPIIYGIKNQEIRQSILRFLKRKVWS